MATVPPPKPTEIPVPATITLSNPIVALDQNQAATINTLLAGAETATPVENTPEALAQIYGDQKVTVPTDMNINFSVGEDGTIYAALQAPDAAKAVKNARADAPAGAEAPKVILSSLKLTDLPVGTADTVAIVDSSLGFKNVKGSDANDNVILNSQAATKFATKDGNDTVVISNAEDNKIKSGNGNDNILAGSGDDKISGGADNDTLGGGAGDDNIKGSSGTDNVDGGLGNDKIDGGSDNDILNGRASDDTIKGGSGDDTIDGGAGNNELNGSQGADTFIFDIDADGTNTIKGFKSDDILQIIDRNGDGAVTEGADGDYTVSNNGKDLVIDLKDDGSIVLKGAGKFDLTESITDDGTFSITDDGTFSIT